tara:strand:- start:2493 stop:3233 length:741 start_codon:yes stop_codon:yes gene_type:complete
VKSIVTIIFMFLCINMVNAKSVKEAVEHQARTETDRVLDDKRKPTEVLEFFGIQPGMKVLDVFGGGGYYTEILSYLVGETGSVTLYNNSPWNAFVNKSVTERLKDNRLPNVKRVVLEPMGLETLEEKFDAAIFVLGMHDIYYVDEENGWPAIDKEGFLANIHRLLKGGAVFGIIDHNAVSGTDPSVVGKSVHRIDPAVLIRDLTAAGFEFEGESNVLRNPNDTLDISVFDQSISRKTDRSILKFRK